MNALRVGGIVLCGGESRRMGRPKLSLRFGDETMLGRVVRILSEIVSPIVIVAARDQELPSLPSDVLIARDEERGLGPLAGLGTGLAALGGQVDAVYASACDVPLLSADFVRTMIAALGEHDLAIPREGEFYHPLAAVYRPRVLPTIHELISAGRMRPLYLVEQSDAAWVDVESLRAVDPNLDSLRNLNTPEDYEAACRAAGVSP